MLPIFPSIAIQICGIGLGLGRHLCVSWDFRYDRGNLCGNLWPWSSLIASDSHMRSQLWEMGLLSHTADGVRDQFAHSFIVYLPKLSSPLHFITTFSFWIHPHMPDSCYTQEQLKINHGNSRNTSSLPIAISLHGPAPPPQPKP